MASSLRKRITIQSRALTSDGGGGYTEVWSNTATVFAQVRPVKADERLFAFKLQSKISHRITIRYRVGITADMRVKMGTRYFSIISVINPDEANQKLELMCEELA